MWKIVDRWQNVIILTDERWQHISDYHWELKDRLNDIIKTIRLGKRKQDRLLPQKFYYTYFFSDLPHNYTHINVVVKLEFTNFVITAYPIAKKR